MRLYHATEHSFAVCAYEESPYLDMCIRSLLKQTIKSNILIATSTPNAHIRAVADRYRIPVVVNTGKTGLANDWNYAYHAAPGSLVTLAHQDDVYFRNYLANVLKALNICRHPLICFTDYQELKKQTVIRSSLNLSIKRSLLTPMRYSFFWKSRFVRRRIMSLGNPFCCPSATFVKDHLGNFSFRDNMKSNIDWQAWEELSWREGEFAYVDTPCMLHRIHPGSTTTEIIGNHQRIKEDYHMLKKFWPDFLCVILETFYQYSEKSNQL